MNKFSCFIFRTPDAFQSLTLTLAMRKDGRSYLLDKDFRWIDHGPGEFAFKIKCERPIIDQFNMPMFVEVFKKLIEIKEFRDQIEMPTSEKIEAMQNHINDLSSLAKTLAHRSMHA